MHREHVQDHANPLVTARHDGGGLRRRVRSRRSLLAGVSAGGLLLLAAPGPAEALSVLRNAAGALDPLAPVVAAVTLLSWALAAWLLLAVLLTGASHVPGRVGVGCAALLRRVAPAAARRALAVALGTGVALGTVGVGAASASSVSSVASTAATGVDLGASESAAATPGIVSTTAGGDRPASTTSSRAAAPAGPQLDWPGTPADARSIPAEAQVVVAPGDTLWALAAAAMPDNATDAQIAASWPAWWSTNRQVIGEDPHLLHPGQALQPPAAPSAAAG